MCFVKICQQCGKEFTTKRYPTQFCSPRCYNQHKRTERNKRKLQLIKQYDSHIDVVMEDGKLRYIKQCDHCGKEFKAPRPTGRFCCTKCHDDHDRKKKQEYNEVLTSEERHKILKGKFLPLKKFCVHCGSEFTAYKQTTMFCSSACAKKYRIRQSLEERATKVTAESRRQDAQRKESAFAAKDIMRVKDVCEYLSLSRTTIYRYIEQGILKPLVLPGTQLFRKDTLDQLFKDGVRFRESASRLPKTSASTERPQSFVHMDEYISISEAAKVYGLPLNVTQNYLRRSELPFERFRNVRLYKREEVDRLLRKRERDQHHEIEEWYTVEDIMTEYEMTRKQVYNLMGVNPKLPRRKEGLKTFYSKRHVDKLLKPSEDLSLYYTPSEVMDKYHIEIRRLYKVAKRLAFKTYSASGRIWYLKEDVDAFFES